MGPRGDLERSGNGRNDGGNYGGNGCGNNNNDNGGADDGGETTDGGEEPLSSDVDTPALSTVSSITSADLDKDLNSLNHKRKLSVSPSDEIKAARKFPRTSYKKVESSGTEEGRSDDDNHAGSTKTFRHLKISCESRKSQPGMSRSAAASRKLRKKASSGTYVLQGKRLETWKKKIANLDRGAQFDRKNSRRVFHSQCSNWVLVKEPGDTTRFKHHVETCQAKPVPVRGTLTGMGWLTAKKEVGTSSDRKDGGRNARGEGAKDRVNMPCRGVSEMDNPLVGQYLTRAGAGGGGGRSIHVISSERFKKDFKYLTCAQKDEVQATQRAEWRWTNDYASSRVYSRKCMRFTLSHSLALSLCAECEGLLVLKAFSDIIRKPVPSGENLKFINAQFLHPVLGRLYKKAKGLRAIIEESVSKTYHLPDLS